MITCWRSHWNRRLSACTGSASFQLRREAEAGSHIDETIAALIKVIEEDHPLTVRERDKYSEAFRKILRGLVSPPEAP